MTDETLIQNALRTELRDPSFALVGPAGSGKTTAFLSFPRPALAMLFDPNGSRSLQGQDIDIIEFPPADAPLDLRTGRGGQAPAGEPPKAYTNFMQWFNDFKDTADFAKYKSIMLDSATSLEWAIKDELEYLSLRTQTISKFKDEDATKLSTSVRDTSRGVFRSLTSTGKFVLATFHRKVQMTDKGQTVAFYELAVIGEGRRTVPNSFTDLYYTSHDGDSQGIKYIAQTRAGGKIHDAKCSFKGTPYEIDLTISDFSKPEHFGLGALIKTIEKGKK